MQLNLRAARVNAGLSVEEAAHALGIVPATLRKWENEITYPTTDRIPDIAQTYGLKPNDIKFF